MRSNGRGLLAQQVDVRDLGAVHDDAVATLFDSTVTSPISTWSQQYQAVNADPRAIARLLAQLLSQASTCSSAVSEQLLAVLVRTGDFEEFFALADDLRSDLAAVATELAPPVVASGARRPSWVPQPKR